MLVSSKYLVILRKYYPGLSLHQLNLHRLMVVVKPIPEIRLLVVLVLNLTMELMIQFVRIEIQ